MKTNVTNSRGDGKNVAGKERKNREFHMRLTKSQLDLLDSLSYEDEKTKAETVIKALNFYANFKKGSF